MGSISSPSRRTPTGRRRGRPPGTTNAARAARQASLAASAASEPPPKKRRYIPGGAGGGGRFVDPGDLNSPLSGGMLSVSRARASMRDALNSASPSLVPKRERSVRTRAAAADSEDFGFAAAVAASVQQADDYKPREERNWEEFHPHLDIERPFMVFRSADVDGITQEIPNTPAPQTPGTPLNGSMTPSRQPNPASTGNTPSASTKNEANPFDAPHGTPTRRSRRPTRDVVSFYGPRPDIPIPATPKTPKVLPIKNQTAKERLDLKQPSYRKTNRIELFESKTFGQARYVDKAMSNVGYQESDHFDRSERHLIKAPDANAEDDFDTLTVHSADDGANHSRFGRVEYDMDEQDDMWLEQYNKQRKGSELEAITREIFEITMTKIEKEWHALEKRIPKPNPKPPQTHRPRSSSAAAVNGEPQAGDEPDSRCAICDDGDCENTNAIVFCDGCNLAVHQECYGVPFIPEGQWLCRKCQLCGRGVPTCIFCPNTDGAFKQTSASKWAHLLCAMWIPEVSLGNHTFMEPVMDVEKVPKTRWKLNCYICNQKMGACIQCSNKNCYQAFHVTCARRAKLYLKMKTPAGQLAVLDGSMILKAFCNKHCPQDYTVEHDVYNATRAAKRFYKRNMKGRIWAHNHAVANVIAAQQRNTDTDHDEHQAVGGRNGLTGDKKKAQSPKNVWRLPSGAPVIPQAVFDVVEASLQRFPFRKRKDYLGEACRYWTLKREARRGAALLKRLQLQMDSFSSMELTRRNFAAMGPDGKERLARRIQFAEMLIKDLEQLKDLSAETVQREQKKLEAAELEQDFVDECYFPVVKLLVSAVEKAISLDKELFEQGLAKLQSRVEQRYYTRALVFAQDLGNIIRDGIATNPELKLSPEKHYDSLEDAPTRHPFADIRERRKLGKRILKAIQPQLETALRIESEISDKPFEPLQKDLEARIEASLDVQQSAEDGAQNRLGTEELGTIMVDASLCPEALIKKSSSAERPEAGNEDAMDVDDVEDGNIEVQAPALGIFHGEATKDVEMTDDAGPTTQLTNGVAASQTPPDSNDDSLSPKGRPQNGPPTPPQSNGSLGKDADPLADGGVLWYLKSLEPQGTSILGEEEGSTGDDGRSEDLTDLDDEELKALGAEVDGSLSAVMAAAEETKEEAVAAATPKGRAAAKAGTSQRRTSARRR